MLASGLCLSTLDATAKLLARDYPVTLITWARYAGHLLFVLAFAYRRRGWAFLHTRRLAMQLTRSALLLAATLCFFSGVRYVPIAEATAVSFLAPVFIILLARPMLGERVASARWTAALVGFAGVLLLVRPGGEVFQPAILLVIAMALCNALYQLLTRKLAGEDPYTSLFYSAFVGTVAMSFALPWMLPASLPAWRDVPLFALTGLLGGAGHLLLIHAYSRAPAGMITPFAYIQLVWATMYGALLFHQLPDAVSALGMALIAAGGIGLAWSERRRARVLAAASTRAGAR
jgi:drug/metabolite transporter (DMT)-like permease